MDSNDEHYVLEPILEIWLFGQHKFVFASDRNPQMLLLLMLFKHVEFMQCFFFKYETIFSVIHRIIHMIRLNTEEPSDCTTSTQTLHVHRRRLILMATIAGHCTKWTWQVQTGCTRCMLGQSVERAVKWFPNVQWTQSCCLKGLGIGVGSSRMLAETTTPYRCECQSVAALACLL